MAGETTSVGDDADRQRRQRYLYHRYHRPLVRYVVPIVNGDRPFAEDIVQETMLRAWLHIDDLVPERAGPWLYTVAHNLAISLYHRKRRAVPQEQPMEDAPFSGAADDVDVDRMLETSDLRAAMRQLRPQHRDAIVHLFYLQRSVAEAAAALDIPAGTVKSRAFYGLRELRAILDRQGGPRR